MTEEEIESAVREAGFDEAFAALESNGLLSIEEYIDALKLVQSMAQAPLDAALDDLKMARGG